MRPLRIGVDARELLGDRTGVGRYLGELLRRWVRRTDGSARRFVLYSPSPLDLPLPADAAECRVVGPRRGAGTWWEQTALRRAARGDDIDVFFAPAYTAPLGIRAPLAVTIHDISFVAHPEWYRVREGLRRRWLTARAADTARVVLTDSAFSAGEIAHHFHVPADRLRVIPPGVSVVPRAAPAVKPPHPYVLYAGSLFNRRRLPDLIAAFAAATEGMARTRLVIAGADRTWPPQDLPGIAASYGIAGRVDFRHYVGDDELAGLYAGASVFAFLSEYEGFGLTPLEALAAGVPIVVLDTPVAREVYGEAAIYVPPDDVARTAEALRRVLRAPREADGCLAHAPAVLARYCWDEAAGRTLAELERIADR